MSRHGLIFRVFVSSTFSDMSAERNALQERVFPRLREICQQYGARFQAVDLRWGISEEAAVDQQTINICLEELRRCQHVTRRPNLIVLLGHRYGWCPLPPQVAAGEFESLLAVLPEPHRAHLGGWYQRDDNAVPAEYCLRPREEGCAGGSTWAAEEQALRGLFREAIACANWEATDARRFKYEASATHREIQHGALQRQHAPDHVFAFFRTFEHVPAGAATRDFFDLDPSGQPDAQAQERLSRVKSELQATSPGNTFTYTSKWTGTGPARHYLQALCADAYEQLRRVIEEEIRSRDASGDAEQEATAHASFGHARARLFVGRHEILERIRGYLAGPARYPLVVHGPSGSGKSALLAEAAETQPAIGADRSETVVRYIGATPGSSDVNSLLRGLCDELGTRYQASVGAAPLEFPRLVLEFSHHLVRATAARPLVLFIDALDQLSDAEVAGNLAWLPRELPSHVKIVVSTLRGPWLSILQRRFAGQGAGAPGFVEMTPMSEREGEQLLASWLGEAHRTLQPPQWRRVLQGFSACPYPLYLRLVFEEARRWKSWEPCTELTSGTDAILANLFARLEQPQHHGHVLVSRTLGYLAASRHGLTEDEMLDVLSADKDVMADFRRRSPRSPELAHLPAITWARLFADIEPYMTTRAADGASVLTFYHRQVEVAATATYLAGDEAPRRHSALADYYRNQADPQQDRSWQGASRRAFLRLPVHLAQHRPDELVELLLDFHWLQGKTDKGLVRELIQDFDHSLATLPPQHPSRRALELLRGALALCAHILVKDASQLRTQLHARLMHATEPALHALVRRIGVSPGAWLRALTSTFAAPGGALVHTLVGHDADLTAVAVSANGRIAVTAAADKTLKAWDLKSGAQLASLEGHTAPVRAVAIALDAQRALSASDDRTVRLWDLETFEPLGILFQGDEQISALGVSTEGRGVAFACQNTVRAWDLVTMEMTLEVKVGDKVTDIAWCPQRSLMCCGVRKRIVVLDTNTCRPIRVLHGHRDGATFALTTDGRKVISAGADELIVWDLQTGQRDLVVQGGGGKPAVAADARRVVCGSKDRVRILDLPGGEAARLVEGHAGPVKGVAVSDDGRWLASIDAQTLRVWDLDLMDRLRPRMHASAVKSIALGDSARLAVSRSNDSLHAWCVKTGRELLTPLEYLGGDRVRMFANSRLAMLGCLSGDRLFSIEGGEEMPVDAATSLHPGGAGSASGSGWSIAPTEDAGIVLRESGEGGNSLKFIGESQITAWAFSASRKLLVAGEASGAVHFLEIARADARAPKPVTRRLDATSTSLETAGSLPDTQRRAVLLQLNARAIALEESGRTADAAATYEQALVGARDALGASHPWSQCIWRNLECMSEPPQTSRGRRAQAAVGSQRPAGSDSRFDEALDARLAAIGQEAGRVALRLLQIVRENQETRFGERDFILPVGLAAGGTAEIKVNTRFSARRLEPYVEWLGGDAAGLIGSAALALDVFLGDPQAPLHELAAVLLLSDVCQNVIAPWGVKPKMSLSGVSNVAQAYLPGCACVQLDLCDAAKLRPPFIASTKGEEFVVVTRWQDSRVHYRCFGVEYVQDDIAFLGGLNGFFLAAPGAIPAQVWREELSRLRAAFVWG